MAKKKYDFTITLQPAQHQDGFFFVAYGILHKNHYAEETVTMTLDEAVAYRDQLSAQEQRTHEARISMADRCARSAPGLSKVERLQKKGINDLMGQSQPHEARAYQTPDQKLRIHNQ